MFYYYNFSHYVLSTISYFKAEILKSSDIIIEPKFLLRNKLSLTNMTDLE